MNYNPEKHHRRSIRLKGYDYTGEGAYYFTICCHQMRCLLGEIKDGVMHLNLVGATVKAVWDSLPRHFPLIELDAFVVMPNHVHGIIVITDTLDNSNFNRNNNPTSNLNPDCRGVSEAVARNERQHSCQDVTTHHQNLYPRMLRPFRDVTILRPTPQINYLAARNPVQ
jgi:REP element-mobilizing transposase RayT